MVRKASCFLKASFGNPMEFKLKFLNINPEFSKKSQLDLKNTLIDFQGCDFPQLTEQSPPIS